ncbi:MAP3K7 C-terminal-like protein [Merluccius polli]|uniref:MAP3K7 C-terminal-like protein n=1 Tax=Merluccius polli TaxID=89951 RepID=A0AA47N0E4_MERPO|nr:MAP3K7 C-terminal-like protein [Merluccius polli]
MCCEGLLGTSVFRRSFNSHLRESFYHVLSLGTLLSLGLRSLSPGTVDQFYTLGRILEDPVIPCYSCSLSWAKINYFSILWVVFLLCSDYPVPPCVSLRESVHVYREHCKMAREFHQVKHDIAMLEDRKRKLLAELVEDDKVAMEIARLEEEFHLLTEENRNLASVHTERAQQLESLWQTTKPEDS